MKKISRGRVIVLSLDALAALFLIVAVSLMAEGIYQAGAVVSFMLAVVLVAVATLFSLKYAPLVGRDGNAPEIQPSVPYKWHDYEHS